LLPIFPETSGLEMVRRGLLRVIFGRRIPPTTTAGLPLEANPTHRSNRSPERVAAPGPHGEIRGGRFVAVLGRLTPPRDLA